MKKAWIIDDDDEMSHAVRLMLELLDFEVQTYREARRAAGVLLAGQRPDLIVLEIHPLSEAWSGQTLSVDWIATNAGNYYEATAGINYRPHANVVLRPEVRIDWYDGVTPYMWLVLLIASLGWIFDVFEGQIFVASMEDAMPALVDPAQPISFPLSLFLDLPDTTDSPKPQFASSTTSSREPVTGWAVNMTPAISPARRSSGRARSGLESGCSDSTPQAAVSSASAQQRAG